MCLQDCGLCQPPSADHRAGAASTGSMWTIGSLSVRESALVGTLILDFAIQWSAFVVAAILKTEVFYGKH